MASDHAYKEYSPLVETNQRRRDSMDTEMEMQQVSTRRIFEEREKEGKFGGAPRLMQPYYWDILHFTVRFTLDI